MFWRNILLPSSRYNSKPIMQPAWHRLCLLAKSCWLHACFTLQPWRWRQYVLSKRHWTSTRLHGITTHETVLFVVTAVRTSRTIPGDLLQYAAMQSGTYLPSNMAIPEDHNLNTGHRENSSLFIDIFRLSLKLVTLPSIQTSWGKSMKHISGHHQNINIIN
jgi:hypothetical protein